MQRQSWKRGLASEFQARSLRFIKLIMKEGSFMSLIGNIIWFLFGGFLTGLLWFFVGILWCITVIGIPVGLQCFKFGVLSFWPFGKDVQLSGTVTSLILNMLWLIFGGVELAITHAVFGLILCCTIIGIPFGMQHFKLAKLALLPFGAQIVEK